MIEDYFFVNTDTVFNIPPLVDHVLVDSFCISGPGVFKFELALNPNNPITNNMSTNNSVEVMLIINQVVVAQARSDDADFPSNLSLKYRTRFTE